MGQDKARLSWAGSREFENLAIQMGECRAITLCGDKRKKAIVFGRGVA